jgi:uncharacterized protein (DUF427 family)
MGVRMRDQLGSTLGSLRYEPTAKRIRAMLGGQPVADSTGALLLWEPRRVVPTYAVPAVDVVATLAPAGSADPAAHEDVGLRLPEVSSRLILDPRIPFAAHTSAGTSLDVESAGQALPGAAFRPADPDLADYIVLDFAAFSWLEEDEPILSHPRDPFHRIDVLRSRRHVRLELHGLLLAESSRPVLLFETLLPVRCYLPREDVAVDLQSSDTVTYCAYKGRAAYFSLPGGPYDLAWTYRQPLHDAEPVRDRVAFFDERVDVVLDGERRDRPITPWSG